MPFYNKASPFRARMFSHECIGRCPMLLIAPFQGYWDSDAVKMLDDSCLAQKSLIKRRQFAYLPICPLAPCPLPICLLAHLPTCPHPHLSCFANTFFNISEFRRLLSVRIPISFFSTRLNMPTSALRVTWSSSSGLVFSTKGILL